MTFDSKKIDLALKLKGSLLEFTKFFFEYITGREFTISHPIGRESHHITICRELTRAFRLEIPNHRLLINVPPGHGKSTLLCMWIAWAFAHYPDCRFLYISYSADIATRQTEFIKRIISSQMYKYLFDLEIRSDSKAKSNFMTTAGGVVAAFGSSGSIVGVDAGYPNLERFSGAAVCDDLHKIEDVHSDLVREGTITNFKQTILQRLRGINVPLIGLGQRTHESDIFSWILNGGDGYKWTSIILKALDVVGNALYPEAFPKEMLLKKSETDPYTFASQFQQEPVPSGGSLFKPDWFVILDQEPQFISTFITADTAETSKSWNDATAFSFWGVYEIESMGRKIGELGLHWLDCVELRIEPKDLKETFVDFYANCSLHSKPPLLAAIEKKSTGVTLISVLRELRGMSIREIERTAASGSKTQRFLEMQPYIASRRISFTGGARHVEGCIQHMSKITANMSHKHDDRADNLYDAIKIALIEKTMHNVTKNDNEEKTIYDAMNKSLLQQNKLGQVRYGSKSSY